MLLDAERSAAAFGFGLARGIRRLQNAEGSGAGASTDRRLLRAAALSVSNALESGKRGKRKLKLVAVFCHPPPLEVRFSLHLSFRGAFRAFATNSTPINLHKGPATRRVTRSSLLIGTSSVGVFRGEKSRRLSLQVLPPVPPFGGMRKEKGTLYNVPRKDDLTELPRYRRELPLVGEEEP